MDKSHTHLFVYLQSQYPEVDVTSDFFTPLRHLLRSIAGRGTLLQWRGSSRDSRLPLVPRSPIGSFTEFTENQLLSIEGASYWSCIQWAWQCLLGHL